MLDVRRVRAGAPVGRLVADGLRHPGEHVFRAEKIRDER